MAAQGDYAYNNRRKDPRRRGVFSINCLKYVLFVFNLIFLVAGCAILGVGIWTLHSRHDQLLLMTSSAYVTVAALFIVAGALVLIVTVFGCIAIAREDRCYLLMYTTGVLLVFIIEAVAGVLAYVYEMNLQSDLSQSLTDTFNDNYGKDSELSMAIDAVQIKNKCCGAISFSQWEKSYWKTSGMALNNTVPDSCCKTPTQDCGIRDHPSNIWHSGCIYGLKEEIGVHLLLLGAIGLGISSIHIIGLVFSCCLFVKLKDIDDY